MYVHTLFRRFWFPPFSLATILRVSPYALKTAIFSLTFCKIIRSTIQISNGLNEISIDVVNLDSNKSIKLTGANTR